MPQGIPNDPSPGDGSAPSCSDYRWFERPLLEAREAITTRLGIARIER